MDRRWLSTVLQIVPLVLTALLPHSAHACADDAKQLNPAVAQDGTVHVPAFDLPVSVYLSSPARKAWLEQMSSSPASGPPTDFKKDFASVRAKVKASLEPVIKRVLERYSVNTQEQDFGGVHALVVTPKNGVSNYHRDQVLINLHGGGFAVGDASSIGLIESAPVAVKGNFQIVTVDYRQGPEFQFPAASEDVAAVYRALLKNHKPQNIGIYGCSAGGLLTAEAVVWLQRENLPGPGAIGIFCASGDAAWAGDAYFTVPPMTGQPPLSPTAPPDYGEKYYYGNNDLKDPLMSPVFSSEMLAKFPPTLLITGTRAGELSSAVYTHTQLVKAGVKADLHVWDGMWHAFFFDSDLPESQEAYDVMTHFFEQHLGRKKSTGADR